PPPAERERYGDEHREHDAPEDGQVREPARCAPLADERLAEDVSPEGSGHQRGVAPEILPGEKRGPARAKIVPRGRPLDPERVAIRERGDGEHGRHEVPNERGIEIREAA